MEMQQRLFISGPDATGVEARQGLSPVPELPELHHQRSLNGTAVTVAMGSDGASMDMQCRWGSFGSPSAADSAMGVTADMQGGRAGGGGSVSCGPSPGVRLGTGPLFGGRCIGGSDDGGGRGGYGMDISGSPLGTASTFQGGSVGGLGIRGNVFGSPDGRFSLQPYWLNSADGSLIGSEPPQQQVRDMK